MSNRYDRPGWKMHGCLVARPRSRTVLQYADPQVGLHHGYSGAVTESRQESLYTVLIAHVLQSRARMARSDEFSLLYWLRIHFCLSIVDL